MAPDVTIVIVNYKMRAVLLECLDSIHRADHGVKLEVVVVDNESDGALKPVLTERFPSVTLIENAGNDGFAAASNQGMRAGSGRYVLFLNPDTEMPPGTLRRMIAYLEENPGAGIAGPRTINVDGSHEPSVYNFPSVFRTMVDVLYLGNLLPFLEGYERKHAGRRDGAEYVEVICGACLMASRANLERLGAFDDELWMYGEDVELCYRFRRAGLRAVFLGDCSITHKRGSKHLDESTVVDMERIAYWHYRWIFHFHIKHSGRAARFIIWRLLLLNITMKYLPRRKKLLSEKNTSRDNKCRVRAFERLLREYYGKDIPETNLD